jgi:anti-sigma factor ChrR (cupin superfamily)
MSPDTAALLAGMPADFERRLDWEPFRKGIEVSWIYRTGPDEPSAAFLRYEPGARAPHHLHAGTEHVLVLRGSQRDLAGVHGTGSLVVNQPGTPHDVVSDDGCLVLIIWAKAVVFKTPAV